MFLSVFTHLVKQRGQKSEQALERMVEMDALGP